MNDATHYSQQSALQIVWFKRDLRLEDHEALHRAIAEGIVIPIALIETELWRSSQLATQHYQFALECYQDLHESLAALGLGLSLIVCEQAPQAFDWLRRQIGPYTLHSHMETGDAASFARDRAMLAFCREHQIEWRQYRQFGVVRGLKARSAWASQWESLMRQAVFRFDPVGALQSMGKGREILSSALARHRRVIARETSIDSTCFGQQAIHGKLLLIQLPEEQFRISEGELQPYLPSATTLSLDPLSPTHRQRGGIKQAALHLSSFLSLRSAHYRGGISSPLRAPEACSRLSVYLSHGCLSMREVVQRSRAHREALGDPKSRQAKGLEGFLSRLHWHCHFIQKLETEPAIEWQNMHRGYDGLREAEFDLQRFEALKAGNTGWPMVDACVRMLESCGWLNFRMRAMLVSVAAYPLWLHWREVGWWLARHFLDYEPGIHWSQMQMQSGTTGINTTRVYNPIKQALEHDPQGQFVRQWIPALKSLPDQFVFEPWKAPLKFRLAASDPIAEPVVDLAQATREAKARVHALRATASVIAETEQVVRRHASAKRDQERYLPAKHPRSAKSKTAERQQLSFDFDDD